MSSSSEFLDRLQPIVTDRLYIGTEPNHLDNELRQNTWQISASEAERESVSIEDIEAFINAVVHDRREQVKQAYQNHGMLFYLWFDA